MPEFIYIATFVVVALLLWIGYEIHRVRAETRLNYILGRLEAQMESRRPDTPVTEPQLFDQEQP